MKPSHGKRFEPPRWMARLAPALMVLLALMLLGVFYLDSTVTIESHACLGEWLRVTCPYF